MSDRTLEPHVGMKLWAFDETVREYARDERGHGRGGPLYRPKWVQSEIVGETRVSWIIKCRWQTLRLPKKSFPPGNVKLTEGDVDEDVWVAENRYPLSERVRKLHDYNTLVEIEKLVLAQEAKKS